jgi:hypothetical protein
VQSLGPVQITAKEVGTKLVYISRVLHTYTLTELTAVTIIKAVFALAGEDVGCKLGDISEGDRSHEVRLADWDGEDALLLSLRCIQ